MPPPEIIAIALYMYDHVVFLVRHIPHPYGRSL